MLLNLSNHPSSLWSKPQIQAAINRYASIKDLPFPLIDPNLDEKELDSLVDKYLEKIKEINPTCVHIMGELTFTYRMINRLKAIGMKCVASTTSRKVIEDGEGNKTSTFNFIKFREY